MSQDQASATSLTPQERQEALNVARRLAELGIPIFVAPPSKTSTTGFALPTDWQKTEPDPAVVDTWQPGYALCAVMGRGLDLVDIDPRNDGDIASLNGTMPVVYASATTPSGGWHYFVKSLGVGSRTKIYNGIDLKGGMTDASSRGFAFISPTEKPSKAPEHAGEVRPYRWEGVEGLDGFSRDQDDSSGSALALRVRELRSFVAKPRGVLSTGMLGQWAAQREPQRFDAAERAINDKLADVRDWSPAGDTGFRQTLMRASLTLGGYVGCGYLNEADAVSRLREAVEECWGSPDEEDETWIQDGLRDGQVRPFAVYSREQEIEWEREQRESEAAWAAQQAREQSGAPVAPNSDLREAPPPPPVTYWIGNEPFDPADCRTDQCFAERVAERVRPALRYATDAGVWLERLPERWIERKKTDSLDDWAISEAAKLMPLGDADFPKNKADYTPENWQAARWRDFHNSAPSGRVAKKLNSLVAGSGHPSSLRLAELDTDPEVLWAGGMPWSLSASVEVPTLAWTDPNEPHLHTAACIPRLIETPVWDHYLETVWPDPEIRAWALRLLAVGVTGHPDAVLPYLFGTSRSGKSSLVSFMIKALGTYGIAANAKLLSPNDGSHDVIIYQLKGARLAFIDEGITRHGASATERLKQLTGGAQLTARSMNANPIVFEPTHTLVMTSNEPPPLTDPALRARLRVIPCDTPRELTYPAWQRLKAAWHVEVPGVLAKMMIECARWLEDRGSTAQDNAPTGWRADLADLEAEGNPIHRWVELCTVPQDPGTQVADLYEAYVAWHDSQITLKRTPAVSATTFGTTLTELGYPVTVRKINGKACRYRPLSVLGGGGYGPPIQPRIDTTLTDRSVDVRVTGSEPVTPPVTQPVTPESYRSHPISSSSGYGLRVEGGTGDKKVESNPYGVPVCKVSDGARGVPVTHNPTPQNSASDQGVSGSYGHSGDPVTVLDTVVDVPETGQISKSVQAGQSLLVDLPEGLPVDYDLLAPITPAQKKIFAAAAGCSVEEASARLKVIKSAAKVQEKDQARDEKIRELSGPEHTLPVAVNRALEIHPIPTEEITELIGMSWKQAGGELTVDMENTGYPIGHRHYALKTVQLGWEQLTLVLDPSDPEQSRCISWALANAPVLVAHSGQADLVALAHEGLGDFEAMMAKLRDTAVDARLVDPKITGSDGGLKDISVKVLGDDAVTKATEEARKQLFAAGGWLTNTEITTPIERSGWAKASKTGATMIRYAGADVLDTAAIAKRLPMIESWLREREHTAQHMTSRVTFRGLPLDAEKIHALTSEHVPARAKLAREILAVPGTAIVNPGSDKQVATALTALGAVLPKTEKGNPQVAHHVLVRLRDDAPETAAGQLAKLMLDWRHHDTALGTFLGPYATLVEHGDGRVRPTIYTVGTDTGRMSSVRPNIQQLPREGGFRSMVLADPGMVFISADFSGVELRGAAALSGDPMLLAKIEEEDANTDPDAKVGFHWLVAHQAFGPNATKAHRYTAKRGVFGTFYGGGAERLAQQVGVRIEDMRAIRNGLKAQAPHFFGWSDWLQAQVRAGHTQYPSYSGRPIHFPADTPHKAPAYAIQGSCRELLVDALMRWRQTKWGTQTLIPVHDELIVQVPAEDAHEATLELVRCMEGTLTGLSGATVRIIADAGKPDKATGRYLGSTFWGDST